MTTLEPQLTIEQAAGCIEAVYLDAPYAEALRLKVGALVQGDQAAATFWNEVASRLGFERPKRA